MLGLGFALGLGLAKGFKTARVGVGVRVRVSSRLSKQPELRLALGLGFRLGFRNSFQRKAQVDITSGFCDTGGQTRLISRSSPYSRSIISKSGLQILIKFHRSTLLFEL